MKYHHLTTEQRCQIYALNATQQPQKVIAHQLGVSPSTICRELKRNIGQKGYRHKQAQEKTRLRRYYASHRAKKMTSAVITLIKEKLCSKWSPEQIAGRLRSDNISISHESIYRYIWSDKKAGGDLYSNLRRRGKKYNSRGLKTAGRGCIPNRVDIVKRPEIVEKKCRLGDWEGDTIIGPKHQGVILSLVDRKSKLTLLGKMEGKHAKQVPGIIKKCFKRLPRKVTSHSITFDNGKEFSRHEEISKQNKLKCYFATPYRSWERGLNEHTNGLVRQYFPKRCELINLTVEEISFVEDQLNNRPRKVLGYLTPKEVFLGFRRPQKIALQC